MVPILGESGGQHVHGHAVTPVAGHEVDLEAKRLGDLLPQGRELPGLKHEDAIAGRERVNDRRLPGAGTARWIDEDVTLVPEPEDRSQAREAVAPELGEFRPAVVDGRAIDCPQDPVGDVRRAGNLQKVTTGLIRGRTRGVHGKVRKRQREAAESIHRRAGSPG